MLVLGISAVGRGVFGGGLCVGWRIAGRGGGVVCLLFFKAVLLVLAGYWGGGAMGAGLSFYGVWKFGHFPNIS